MGIAEKKRCAAVVLAAGRGKRMEASIEKQYLELKGRPLIAHTLSVFEASSIIDDVLLVAGEGQTEFVRNEVVKRYQFNKVREIAEGGKERYHSVWNGLRALKAYYGEECYANSYVFIHDGARPFIEEDILIRQYADVSVHGTSVAGMPSKDTMKIVDEEAFAVNTPSRKFVWAVQTPQVFQSELIFEAYTRMMTAAKAGEIEPTDDAMAVERYMKTPVKMTEGSYRNIKITTPEDMEIAEVFCQKTIDGNTYL